ncbi:MAG: TetR family transcriptional regulator, partial [Anaerolineaceae bacterium]|nr:TetR family transcriptional regulator [Anaerolineaceae bacterium]
MARKDDRRIQRTRKALRDALHSLVLDRGYDDLSVQDITDKANLGRATFY